jgi:hypothetical protein
MREPGKSGKKMIKTLPCLELLNKTAHSMESAELAGHFLPEGMSSFLDNGNEYPYNSLILPSPSCTNGREYLFF